VSFYNLLLLSAGMSRGIFVSRGGCTIRKLREQMVEDLQLKGLTAKTQRVYLREVSNYAKYFGNSPEELGERTQGVSAVSFE
jgi:hypothetical protein